MKQSFLPFLVMSFIFLNNAHAEFSVEWQVRAAHAAGQRRTRKALAVAMVSIKKQLFPGFFKEQCLSDKSDQKNVNLKKTCTLLDDAKAIQGDEGAVEKSNAELKNQIVQKLVKELLRTERDSQLYLTTADLDGIAFACIQNLYRRVAELEATIEDLRKTQCMCAPK